MMNFPNFPWFHPKIIENLRIASYLSFAANACGAAVNSGALCAGDWTALMANFGEMATVGAAVKEDCDFGKARAKKLGGARKAELKKHVPILG
jgi:hypothetical protein